MRSYARLTSRATRNGFGSLILVSGSQIFLLLSIQPL
jgi:hypothetical protein